LKLQWIVKHLGWLNAQQRSFGGYGYGCFHLTQHDLNEVQYARPGVMSSFHYELVQPGVMSSFHYKLVWPGVMSGLHYKLVQSEAQESFA
jgi:hypothetical protein